MRKHLRGAIGVTVTPFAKDGQADLNAVRAQAERLGGSDVTGVFPCASTGEFPHLDMAEQRAIAMATRDVLEGKKHLIAGACASSLRGSLALVEQAEALQYDACVACPPFYYPLTQAEVYAYYRALAAQAEVPIILYHVPFFTTGIEMDTVEKLLKIPNIIGIKDSSANMKRIAHLCCLRDTREDFLVYTGTDDCLLPALAAGVDGSMTAFAACAPSLVATVYAAYGRGDYPAAQQCQRTMMPLLKAADALPFPLGYKLVAEAYHGLTMTHSWRQMADEATVHAARDQILALLQQAQA
jgi:dihydrodipicolinate synthase/N-acetylneuraminate lyase